jgi:hypothetical protein
MKGVSRTRFLADPPKDAYSNTSEKHELNRQYNQQLRWCERTIAAPYASRANDLDILIRRQQGTTVFSRATCQKADEMLLTPYLPSYRVQGTVCRNPVFSKKT